MNEKFHEEFEIEIYIAIISREMQRKYLLQILFLYSAYLFIY